MTIGMSMIRLISVRLAVLILCLCFQVNIVSANIDGEVITLQTVMQLLAKKQYTQVKFIEHKSSALLAEVIQIEGVLNFKPPAYLLKRVLKPYHETFELKQGIIYYVKGNESVRKLDIEQYPVLNSFVSAYTALLGGQLEQLKRDYRVVFDGRKYAWRIQLFPRATTMQGYISEIRFNGVGDTVVSIVLIEADGDTTTTRLSSEQEVRD